MTYHFIVSVGTSLIDKYEKRKSADILNTFTGKPFDDCIENDDPRHYNNKCYGSGVEKFDLCLFQNEEDWGAEQKSVHKVRIEKDIRTTDIHFHLIATCTPEGAFSAAILREIWNDCKSIDFCFPEGLGRADEAGFREKGLPNLLSRVAMIMDRIEKEKEDGNDVKAIVIPTGGYKAIIPYLTIASILYKYPAYYIYEKSEELVKLPAPPLGVDTAAFRLALVLMENIVGSKIDLAAPYYDELDEDFRNLICLDSSETYRYTAFGKRLKEMFRQATLSPMIMQATGNKLINRLGSYKEDFKKLARLGTSVWIGDKAPEMADHARYHHLNLFGYAELLLLLLFGKDDNFLNPQELLLLLGVVYLHDCGHTMTSIRKNSTRIPLLHGEIRDFHHLLGYYRIQNHDFQTALERHGVRFDNSFFKAVATVSVYHRKIMPLLNGSYTGPDSICHKALCENSIKFEQSTIMGDTLKLIAAIFRIIDGMDKQVARAGDAVEVVMKAESILADLPDVWERAQRLGNSLLSLDYEAKKEADKFLTKDVKGYAAKEDPASGTSETNTETIKCIGWGCNGCSSPRISPKQQSEETIYAQLKGKLSAKPNIFPMAWEYLCARARFSFLAMQPYYYYTDILLGLPRITHHREDDNIVINIDYYQNDEEEIQKSWESISLIWNKIGEFVRNKINNSEPEYVLATKNLASPESIVTGIRAEYCSKKSTEVAQILNDSNIRIVFKFKGDEVSCWNNEKSNP